MGQKVRHSMRDHSENTTGGGSLGEGQGVQILPFVGGGGEQPDIVQN